MKRIAMRSVAIWILVLLLLGGLGFFLVEYVMYSDQWVLAQGSPHIYKGDNINTGKVLSRDGILLLDNTDGRRYGADEELRTSMIHWLGDRYGYISAPAWQPMQRKWRALICSRVFIPARRAAQPP